MRRTQSTIAVLALFSLAGCGTGYGATSSSSRASTAPVSGTLHVASTSLGEVLVDGAGRTVYLLTADSPGRSSCAGSCLAAWPAVAPPSSSALPGITAAVGRATTPDGTAIATVGGWPLYTFVKDTKPGDVTGEGVQSFGGTWYAVSPSGQPVKAGASGPTGPTYGY
jgi:predicted lipoprotein with Yx(FWY)xxD motif